MSSSDGRWILVFNGEIYNFLEIRSKLEARGTSFRGHSDTEVLLELVARDGPNAALKSARGMFALALWDSHDRVLYLARDRLGEKPLYYGWLGNTFAFASELRALHVHPSWTGRINRTALTAYLRYNCVPAPMCIFEGIRKLEPGRVLSIRANSREINLDTYWDADAALASAGTEMWCGSPDDYVTSLSSLLTSAVGDQMISDVPLGAFLSGGIDSSLIVALMQSQSSQPIRTFTVGFGEDEFDESRYARKIAGILGTDHTEVHLSGADALARVPTLPQCYDEPFADSSQIPTMLVSELARRHVTVSLSGDGGDELFGGYSRYPQVLSRWRRLNGTPSWLRQMGSKTIELVPDVGLRAAGRISQLAWPRPVPPSGLADRIRHRARVWAEESLAGAYRHSVSFWARPAEIVLGGRDAFGLEQRLSESLLVQTDPKLWMRYRDARIYLPDDILAKVDRASMHVSLESRIPLLDHRVVELAWRASTELCYHDGRGKWPLRSLLAKHIPAKLIDRPKMGFAVPLNEWLRGPLKDWAADLLTPARLQREGWFQPDPIWRRWQDLQAGGDGHELALWSVLMFQAWNEQWSSAISS